MCCLENFASSKVAITNWICRLVQRSCQKPFWLLCKIWCFLLHENSRLVRMFVKNLYIVFANAIGR